MAGVADLGTLVVRLTADNRSFDLGMIGSIARMAGFAAAAASAATAVAAVFVKATQVNMEFEKAMVKSLSIMGDADKKYREEMEKTALQMSTDSVTSATELAKAYYYLASAGLDAQRSMKALGVVNQFAIAGDIQLERATEMLTDSVVNLGLASKDAAVYQMNMVRVSDVLAKAGAESNATTEQLAVSLRTKAGAALRTFNKDVEEGVAVLMAFGNQGVKAENAGESLNIVMRDLSRTAINNRQAWADFGVSTFDARGEMRNLGDIISDVEDRMSAFSPEQKKAALEMLGFQDRTVSAFNALLGMGREIKKYEDSMRSAGGFTKKVSEEQMGSLDAQLKSMKNSFEVVAITMAKVWAPEIRAMIAMVKNFALSLTDTTKAAESMGGIGITAAESFGVALAGVAQAAVTAYNAIALVVDGLKAAWIIAQRLKPVKDHITEGVGVAHERSMLEYTTKRLESARANNADAESLKKLSAEQSYWSGELAKSVEALEARHKVELDIAKDADGIKASIEGRIAAMLKADDMRVSAVAKFKQDIAQFREKQKVQEEANAAEKQRIDDLATVTRLYDKVAAAVDAYNKKLAENRSFASQRAEMIDPALGAAFAATDPYRAQSESVNQLNRILKLNTEIRDANNYQLAVGEITAEQYAKNMEHVNFVSSRASTVLAGMNLKGDLVEPWEAGVAALKRYDMQYKDGQARKGQIEADAKRAGLSQAELNERLQQTIVSLKTLQHTHAATMAQIAPSLGQFQGMNVPSAGVYGNTGGRDYTQMRPSGVDEQDRMNELLKQEQLMKDSHQREEDALAAHLGLMTEQERDYNETIKQMRSNQAAQLEANQRDQQHLILESGGSIADSLTSIAADTAGKQSGIYKTMFAISKAFAIADASVKIAQGIAAAAANPFPYNLAAMASVAAATASIVSNIMAVRMTSFEGGGMTPTGARQGGVDGKGGMLSVLHPNEMVIDLQKPANRGPQGLGGNVVNVTVINNAGADVETRKSDDGKNITLIVNKAVEKVASDMRSGRGSVPTALAQTYGLGRART